MIYLEFYEDGSFSKQNNFPFDTKYGFNKSKEELEKTGMLVESLPDELEDKEGYIQVLHLNQEGVVKWRYEEIQLAEEDIFLERIQALEKSNAEMMGLISAAMLPPTM